MSKRHENMVEALQSAFPANASIHASLGLVVMDVAPDEEY